ncbi:phage major tail tube protein [Pseudomonas sp. PDM04]|jgi:P2 family phage contractile tail tube protein|uniref:phage major tail tube protein n=1 Tax=Pseudomonas sp. PDM04 TaxID=2769296 RepID=UPI001783F5BB|nr:phage major tail tube protein [Pseudomonas sp. PDM04]MBD9439026.1 phage major tail tube protein [Pseudomonas sp. PDM04]
MIPEVLSNCAAFIDGVSFAGEVPTLTLPKLTKKTDDYQGGGMSAPIEMGMGLEKLEAAFTTNGVRRESLKYFGLADQTACNAVFRAAYKGLKGAVKAVIVTLRGAVKEVDMGDWKPGDKAEIKHAMSVTYYKLEIDGRVMYEIDPLNMIQVIDGVDQLAAERTALGL